ncbi:NmrA/HSCARG family protein [Hymenobacter busanensis]|uniref:NmrA/HSCARG family protein n=1 Tax=Hymenobacter busanensis TaxID=2607656 RepID=A0A7L4ZSD8_9BACT|nr:NmrA/HSCARG family protein [Hymenobacter busanensis]KAA9325922.1 NmrA/HSCARG family protein [Hymenobacter busanensis]QHJ06239.1 NmrA family NAD(P)-binding protein [Hymenobacter busanensis]
MSDKKIIAVFGATGAQGGGLARAILHDAQSEFAVRAITRNPASDKARELARLGAEVVQADIDDPQSMQRALQGAYGAFFVTFFWDHFSPERELAEVQHMAEAAKAANLQHVIWSTLEDTRRWIPLDDDRMPTLHGHYKVPHTDAKGEADRFFRDLNVPTTFLLTSFYWENLIHFGMGPRPDAEGNLSIVFPMGEKRLSTIAVEDIGRCAYGIFKKGPEMIGKTVGIAGEQRTWQEMAESLTRALGREVRYHAVEPAAYRSFGFPGAEDLGNMFQANRDFEHAYVANRDVALSRELNPQLQSFDAWLAENKERLPLA